MLSTQADRLIAAVPEVLRKPGMIDNKAQRMYKRAYKAVETYDGPSTERVHRGTLLCAYQKTSQKDRFLRDVFAPLERGMGSMMSAAEPLASLTMAADALESSELPEVGALFATCARAYAALASAMANKKERRASAAAFESAAAEFRRQASALADKPRDAKLVRRPTIRNCAIVFAMARDGDADQASREHNEFARLLSFVSLFAVFSAVQLALGSLVFIATNRAAGERLAALQVVLTGTTNEDYIADWFGNWLNISRAVTDGAEPTVAVQTLAALQGGADAFANLRLLLSVVTSALVRQTGTGVATQLALTQFILPVVYNTIVNASQIFSVAFTFGNIALAYRLVYGR